MRKYETLILLSPELSGDERAAILDKLKGVLEGEGSKILDVDEWGMKPLAYPVQNMMRGYYVRLEYAASGETVKELERHIKMDEGIFKFLSVKLADDYAAEEAA